MKVLISDKDKFLVKDTDKNFHCRDGMFGKENFSKKTGKTNKGKEFFVLKPGFIDFYDNIKRGAQIITKKDIGAIIAETGVNFESKALDAGAGSAALSIFLARICKKVVAYEIREDFAKIARKNIEKVGLDNIKVEVRDIYKGIDEKYLDLITLDLKEPWRALEHCHKALKRGGFLVAYSPQLTQVIEFVNQAEGFVSVKVKEMAEREWRIKGRVAKPTTPMISHTGFLTFLRKV